MISKAFKVGAVILTLLAVSDIGAQGAAGGRKGGRAGNQAAQNRAAQRRPLVEQRLQARVDSIVRDRLVLTDDQFARMQEVASKIEDSRRQLRNEESSTRIELRSELLSSAPNEQRVSELLDKMPQIERRRLDLMETEQKELKKFLSPTQRARYLALQDELRRNMQDLQRRRMGTDGPPDRGGPGQPRKVPPPVR
jgi:hypothetical protein